MTEQIGKLEERIAVLKTRLREFMDWEFIKMLEKNSWKRSITVKNHLENEDRDLVEKAVLVYDLLQMHKWLVDSEKPRNEKDKTYKYSRIDEKNKVISFTISFPENDKFFRYSYISPLYNIPKIDFKEAREQANAGLEEYKLAVEFWRDINEEQG